MKTAMVLIAGAMFASMTLAAGSGPTAEERARVKYGRTAAVVAVRPSGAVGMPFLEQWQRAKFGRTGMAAVKSHACAELGRCAVAAAPAMSASAERAHVKYGRPLPVQMAPAGCDHACCVQGE